MPRTRRRRWEGSSKPATTANISATRTRGPTTPGLRRLTTTWTLSAPPQPTEVAPEDLAVQHLGQYATVKWDDEQQYAIGTIVAVSADADAVRLKLNGIDAPIFFPREVPDDGPAARASSSGFKTRTRLTPTSG